MLSQQVLPMGLWSVALVQVNVIPFLVDIFANSVGAVITCFTNRDVRRSALSLSFSFTPGERFFPPPSGLSYSCWFCIEHFSSPPNNHPVRLLTVVRRANSSEQHYVCLAIVLSAKDRSLIVSTKEELLQSYGGYQSVRALF